MLRLEQTTLKWYNFGMTYNDEVWSYELYYKIQDDSGGVTATYGAHF
jgi:hypothetical protein